VGGTTTRFLYDGDQVLAETDASGTLQAKYVYGPGIDESLRMTRGTTTSYYQEFRGQDTAMSSDNTSTA
jgi:hypothetical protein